MSEVGRILAQQRAKRGVSLSEVSGKTRIREAFLLALEEGDFAALPSVGHSKGFVVSYAQYLGLEGDVLAKRLAEEMKGDAPKGRGAFDRAKSTDRKSTDTHEIPWKVVWILLMFILMAGLVAWGLTAFVFNDSTPTPKPPLKTISTPEADEESDGKPDQEEGQSSSEGLSGEED